MTSTSLVFLHNLSNEVCYDVIFQVSLLLLTLELISLLDDPGDWFSKQHVHPGIKENSCTAVMAAPSRNINRDGYKCKEFNTFIRKELKTIIPVCGTESGERTVT
uniref:Ribonuclease A-domain domain-containing protein n=1 Tax=Sander lucioperca TaxID=283035 RepID=A0A8C9YA79_SANLU